MCSNPNDDDRWLEQLARVRRWYARVQRTRPRASSIRITDEDRDFLYAFFVNCFHLEDWMKKSHVLSKDEIKGFFRGTGLMEMCSDICNGAKHLRLDRGLAQRDYQVHVGREYDPESPTGENMISLTTFNGRCVELFNLADWCMGKLETFLSEKGLG